ncbi:MAG: endonuclease/exonuclease/phosphatase family protein [Acidimicrobiia bacterium]
MTTIAESVGWLVIAVSLLASGTSLTAWCPNPIVAALQLLLPWIVTLAAAVGIAALLLGAPALAVGALVAIVAAAPALAPKLTAHSGVAWHPDGVPTLTVGLANLYLENPEPDEAIAQLLESGIDVLVMTELTPDLVDRFDRLGGASAYPSRVHPEPITGAYVVGIFSRTPLRDRRVEQLDSLRVVAGTWVGEGRELAIRAVHPDAPTTMAGFRRWRRQLATLRALLDDLPVPAIVLGDLNAGSLQPPYERLVQGRFRDAHTVTGRALLPSWGIAARLPRWIPPVVARLDHLLLSPDVAVVALDDLERVGSDHRPFRAAIELR